MRWIDVGGLYVLGGVAALARTSRLHPLAVEDVVHVPQRPKWEAYPEQGVVLASPQRELLEGPSETAWT